MEPKDTRRTLAVKMPQETYKRLLFRSAELGCTMHAVVRLLVADWLESDTTTKTPVGAKMEKPLNS